MRGEAAHFWCPFSNFGRVEAWNSLAHIFSRGLSTKLTTVLYGKKVQENSNKSGTFPKMGMRPALRARRTPIFRIFLGFSGWIFYVQ